MSRTVKMILAVMLLVTGITGLVVLLGGEGLDRAEKWVSIVGVTASVVLSGLGLTVSWLAWRRPAPAEPAPAAVPAPAPSPAPVPAPVPGVDVRGARGVQIGDHNTQHNTF
ncbi:MULTISPECIES: hypothetical protein [Catenuloplanes]|uniref:Uncharacterized protein n=1 Tax=Catenuloplanes niger TaxID=587534 RepID=A0AAE3ZN06_9ACTN|nr:hypothetical protein [Catenuloplanes niger]MDR7321620.1 hypothetical protein [Catenuloplanes niger]